MLRKIKFLAVAGMLLSPFSMKAQEFRLIPFYGYTVQDRVPFYEGDLYIRDESQYGGMLQFLPSEYSAVSFMYKASQPNLDLKSYVAYLDDVDNVKTTVGYYMFGFTRFLNGTSEKVSPFGSFLMGWSTWKPEGYNSYSRFTMGFDLGVSVSLSEYIGLNLRSELMMPIQGTGAGVFCGTGGCGASVSTYSSITQLGFTGGIEIKLAPKEKSSNSYTY
ncbi:MAG TPA: hypothetical protein VFW78_11290 [Bacteroidia bacterium]|nr:hypothetical protein [Bacteroidia bacterium]